MTLLSVRLAFPSFRTAKYVQIHLRVRCARSALTRAGVAVCPAVEGARAALLQLTAPSVWVSFG